MRTAARHVSPYSGSWYPGDTEELRTLVERVFSGSEHRTGRWSAPRAAAFVVPHAGLVYSGTVAGAAWRQVRALEPERIILLGFTHRGAVRGAWIPEIEGIETPLGDVEVDTLCAEALVETGAFGWLDERQVCDHSVEIQLPLLQTAAPNARIVPVYVNQLPAVARLAAARALASLAGPGTVLVASSDFTHYGRSFSFQPFPVDESTPSLLRELDDSVIEAAATLDPGEFLRVLGETGATVCGSGPISLLLETLRFISEQEEIFQETLDYQTSGEITGDFRQSVSYAALGYFPYRALELAPDDAQALIESARRTLTHFVATGRREPLAPERSSAALERHAAAFVTLHSEGELRGCIGRGTSTEPLDRLVPRLALSAALDDPRFPPLRPGDAEPTVEISVLSPLKRLCSLERFRVNEHGALLEAGPDRGLLLPQVAQERNWTAAQFLEALVRKAGAPRNVYSDPSTRVHVFRAQVIR
ncbi:MAG TPA: AmmeMemoRadiSam system protein B [Bryobacteraceae bacterium]|nr:AmmeMemoRadiSam system protein B [Bryobacteraceae bacterium]